MERGLVQLYTGNGKGKTTAALGLAFRAAGSGMRTIFIQFMKGQHYGELDSAANLNDLIVIEQYGSEEFCTPDGKNIELHREHALRGLNRSREAVKDPAWDIVVLDEIVTALRFGLVSAEDLLGLIDEKREGAELVLTGRGAPAEIIERCDLVTEMKEVKHYYTSGVQARKGIEF